MKPKSKKPQSYFSVSPDKNVTDCLLWGYSKQNEYIETIGHRHKSMPEFQGEDDFFATGRIYDDRGSVLFQTSNIRLQRIVAEELWSRHPVIKWWVFTSTLSRNPETLSDFLGGYDG